MNIYRGSQIPKKMQTPEHLADEAWHFANTLAAGRWNQEKIEKVEITRAIVETMGFEVETEQEEIEPIFNEIMITFSAFKRVIDGYYQFPSYSLVSSTTQDISSKEVPKNVLDEIFDEADTEEDHPLYDFFEDFDVESDDITTGDFELADVKRTQSVEYQFDHEGNIEDYKIGYSYSIDDVEVHEVEYVHSHSELVWHPSPLPDGSRRPIIVPLLNEESIEGEIRDLDTNFEDFMFMRELREITAFSAQPKEEHIRRLLGMMSMVSGGFVDLRKR